jgi:hypothetical protein
MLGMVLAHLLGVNDNMPRKSRRYGVAHCSSETEAYSLTSRRGQICDGGVTRIGSQPSAGSLTATSKFILDALKSVSSLAWPILRTQCDLIGVDPQRLLLKHLPELLPRLVAATEQFCTPDGVQRLRRLLAAHLRGVRETVPAALAKPGPLSPFAREVFEVLQAFSPLAWSLLEAQASRSQLDARDLQPSDLILLADGLERSLARFGDTCDASATTERLKTLARLRTGNSRSRVSASGPPPRQPARRATTLVGLPSVVTVSDPPVSRRRSLSAGLCSASRLRRG